MSHVTRDILHVTRDRSCMSHVAGEKLCRGNSNDTVCYWMCEDSNGTCSKKYSVLPDGNISFLLDL